MEELETAGGALYKRDLRIDKFRKLFAGRGDAVGLDRGGVERRRVEFHDYENHLTGVNGIGIFPMLDSNDCWFGAIDLDEPNFLLAQSMQLLIPGRSWIERSRSGNAHVWVFFDNPCPAWAIRTILRGATEAVGRKDVEIFPKQDRLREGMVGNYINLPYFGSERPILQDIGEAGIEARAYSLDSFLTLATAQRQSPVQWERRARALGGVPPAEREATGEWGEAPVLHECATHIISRALNGDQPIESGHRHQVLFHLAKQLLNWRDFTNEEAWELLVEVNAGGVKPPLFRGELLRLYNNALLGRYTSTGCDDPIMQPYIRAECPIGNA